jgi:hypothetical protein
VRRLPGHSERLPFSFISLVQPFRWKTMHWVVWQFLNPIIPSVLQKLADLGSDHCEIAIAIWNCTTLAVPCHVRSYCAQIKNVFEIVLEVLTFGSDSFQ